MCRANEDFFLFILAEHHSPEVIALTGVTPSANQRNLAEDRQYAQKLAELQGLLLAEMRRWDDPYRLWDQPDDVAPGLRGQ